MDAVACNACTIPRSVIVALKQQAAANRRRRAGRGPDVNTSLTMHPAIIAGRKYGTHASKL